jgi:hypothetical protein
LVGYYHVGDVSGYDPMLLNYTFLSFFTYYNKIIKYRESNKFRTNKERLDRLGLLQTVICSIFVFEDTMVVLPLKLLNDDMEDDAVRYGRGDIGGVVGRIGKTMNQKNTFKATLAKLLF